ncbi:hypothetical protein EB155_09345 [archaeon]|nr:hypothetical protein [archaeon]
MLFDDRLISVGSSFTAVILTVTVAASSLSTVPSFTLNVKLSLVAVSDVLIYFKSVPESVLGKSSAVIAVSPSHLLR